MISIPLAIYFLAALAPLLPPNIVPVNPKRYLVTVWGGADGTGIAYTNRATITTTPGMECFVDVQTMSAFDGKPAGPPSVSLQFLAFKPITTITWEAATPTNFPTTTIITVPVQVEQSVDGFNWTMGFSTNWISLTNPSDTVRFFRFNGEIHRAIER